MVGCAFYPWGKNGVETRIILKETEKLMSLDNTDLREWCWQNNIPKLDKIEISNWYYENQPLPKPKPIEQISKNEYFQTSNCCQK